MYFPNPDYICVCTCIWDSQVVLVVKNLPANVICRRFKRPGFNPWIGKIPWRRAWQPTPVFLPGKYYGQRLEGYSPWGCKELDMTEGTEYIYCVCVCVCVCVKLQNEVMCS